MMTTTAPTTMTARAATLSQATRSHFPSSIRWLLCSLQAGLLGPLRGRELAADDLLDEVTGEVGRRFSLNEAQRRGDPSEGVVLDLVQPLQEVSRRYGGRQRLGDLPQQRTRHPHRRGRTRLLDGRGIAGDGGGVLPLG